MVLHSCTTQWEQEYRSSRREEKQELPRSSPRWKVHDYLGMIFDFLEKGKVMINMIEYIKGIINNFPEEIIAT